MFHKATFTAALTLLLTLPATAQLREPAAANLHQEKSLQNTPIDRASKKTAPPSVDQPEPEAEAAHLTGEWGGFRQRMSDLGFEWTIVYKGEADKVLSGGLDKDTQYLQNLDVKLLIDAEKAFGAKGLSFFFYGLADKGAGQDYAPTRAVGDYQGTTNIETSVDAAKLYEAWAQQILFEERFSVLFGLHDLNSEFYVTDASSLFLNASFGIGRELSQTGLNGPSIFPNTSLALRLRAEPTKSFYLQTAAFGALPGDPDHPSATSLAIHPEDGFLLITEAGYLPHAENANIAGKIAIGTWAYTRTFDNLDTTASPATSYGSYLLLNQNFSRSFAAFFRTGIASGAVNKATMGLETGVVLKGLLPFRPKDSLGLGLAHTSFGQSYRDLQVAAGTPIPQSENTYELNYRIEVMPGLAVQPDLQYVEHPAQSVENESAWVGAVRLELGF